MHFYEWKLLIEISIEIYLLRSKGKYVGIGSDNGLVTSYYLNQWWLTEAYINGLVQDCSNFTANAVELLQSCTKPLIYVTQSWRVNNSSNIEYLWSQLFYCWRWNIPVLGANAMPVDALAPLVTRPSAGMVLSV